MDLYSRRLLVNRFNLFISLLAMAFGLFWLVWILIVLFQHGFQAIASSLFTQMTPPPNSEGGGLLNAIVGSLVLTLIGVGIGAPIGLLAGTYMAEYGRHSKLTSIIRFINDILLSAPSIIIGLFVYGAVVVPMGGFSGIAGALALAVIVIPVVVRTTENMLRLVPNALREAAFALGTPKWKVIYSITIKASRAGVITGVLLAVARISGETAPLLFTSLSNQFMSFDLSGPTANLPVTIFKFAMSGYDNLITLAWAGVFLITLGVLAINVLARLLFRKEDI